MAEETQDSPQSQQVNSSKPYLPVWGPWQTIGLGLVIFAINSAAQAGVFLSFRFSTGLSPSPFSLGSYLALHFQPSKCCFLVDNSIVG